MHLPHACGRARKEYSNDEPILQATAPLGGDYTNEIATVIALVGRVIPEDDLAMSAFCRVSRGTPRQVEYVFFHRYNLLQP